MSNDVSLGDKDNIIYTDTEHGPNGPEGNFSPFDVTPFITGSRNEFCLRGHQSSHLNPGAASAAARRAGREISFIDLQDCL